MDVCMTYEQPIQLNDEITCGGAAPFNASSRGPGPAKLAGPAPRNLQALSCPDRGLVKYLREKCMNLITIKDIFNTTYMHVQTRVIHAELYTNVHVLYAQPCYKHQDSLK